MPGRTLEGRVVALEAVEPLVVRRTIFVVGVMPDGRQCEARSATVNGRELAREADESEQAFLARAAGIAHRGPSSCAMVVLRATSSARADGVEPA
jgi:hypothetical protein